MKLTTILFDLDGTLLPMDQDTFTHGYFKFLAKKLLPLGYEPTALIDGIWAGVAAMVKNDGSCTNEEAFWNRFASIFGEKCRQDEPTFAEFYRTDFQQARQFCGFNPAAGECVRKLKQMGYRLALATNPLFPATATESRIRWAGLDKDDFEIYTTYENSRFCKPNPDYYREVLEKIGRNPAECLMVGNDAQEDMIAETLGMRVFLLTDCLLNRKDADISRYPQGDFAALMAHIEAIRAEENENTLQEERS